MKITVIQPTYHAGERPDETIAAFLIDELKKAPEGGLIVLPEYSNAGGLSDKPSELAALSRAPSMLECAAEAAKQKKSYVVINVLEQIAGEIKNSSYLFDKQGRVAFVYHKQHLPPSEVELGVTAGEADGRCLCTYELDGIRFAFMTCYDVYFNEQIEFIARYKPDVIVIPGYQRGERTDIIESQAKLTAFRCNATVARSSYSMGTPERGGNSMIVSCEGVILENLRERVGQVSCEVDLTRKYMRPAGFGQPLVRNDDFINAGLCPEAFGQP